MTAKGKVEVITVPSVGAPVGPYSHAVKVTGGSLLFIAGTVGADADQMTPTSFERQCRLAYQNIGATLEAAGTDFEHVVRFTNYVVEGWTDHFPVMAEVRKEFIKDERHYPASTLIEVKGLLYPQLLLEIDTIALVP